MKLSKSVADLQREHVVLELECIDRMYLNAYVPQLTTEGGVAGFVRGYLGHRFASTKAVAHMTENFVESIMQFGLDHKIDLVRFKNGQRKDDVMQGRLRRFKKKHQEVVFIGVAQEKARVPRTVRQGLWQRRHDPLDRLQQRQRELEILSKVVYREQAHPR
jgi:hypothetical protein